VAYLAKFRDALCGPRAPGEENDTLAETGLCTKVGATVTINDFDDPVGKLLPALALMRTSRASTHRQAGIEHQYTCFCPFSEVPATVQEITALATCATRVVGRKKREW